MEYCFGAKGRGKASFIFEVFVQDPVVKKICELCKGLAYSRPKLIAVFPFSLLSLDEAPYVPWNKLSGCGT